MEFEDLSRQRIDYSTGPNGETMATLTITMANGGGTYRYTASTDDDEVDALAAAIAVNELKEARIEGDLSDDEIAGLISFVTGAVKKVGNIAKKIVTSKVFKAAAAGMAMVAPALGPFGAPLLAVAGGMAAASAIGTAVVAAEAGAKKTAKRLRKVAASVVGKFSKSKKGRRALLRIGNRKRKGALRFMRRFGGLKRRTKAEKARRRRALASKRRGGGIGPSLADIRAERRRRKRKKTTTRRRTTARPSKRPNIITAARRGKLRSNKKGSVSRSTLARAARKGRIYWMV